MAEPLTGLALLNSAKPPLTGLALLDAKQEPAPHRSWHEVADPPWYLKPVANYAKGFAQGLADLTGSAVGLVDSTLKDLGTSGVLEQSADPYATAKEWFKKAGIQTDPIDGVAASLGRGSVTSMLVLGALFARSPSMAARAGQGVWANLVRDLGRFQLEFPGRAIALEGGGLAGGEAVPEIMRQSGASDFMEGVGGPAGRRASEIVGGALGAMAGGAGLGAVGGLIRGGANLTQRGVRSAAGMIEDSWRGLTGKPLRATPPGPTAIRDPNVSSYDAVDFAHVQIQQDRAALDAGIKRLLDKTPTINSSGQISEGVTKGLLKAERKAGIEESKYWARAPKRNAVALSNARTTGDAIQGDYGKTSPEFVPKEFIERIQRFTDPALDGTPPPPLTFREAQHLRSALNAAARKESGELAPNTELIANLNKLRGAVLKDMEAALSPGEVADFAAAREYSKHVNDLFYRGPVAEALGRNRQGGARVPPAQVVERLLQRFGGPETALKIAAEFRQRKVAADLGRAVGRMFYEAGEAGQVAAAGSGNELARGVASGQQFVNNNRKAIQALGNVGALLDRRVFELNWLTRERTELEKSAFAKWAGKDNAASPDLAARSIFSASNPAAAVRQVLARLNKDPTGYAPRAFRNALVDQLFRHTPVGEADSKVFNVVPSQIMAQLIQPKIRSALQAALGKDYARLRRIVQNGVRVEEGDSRLLGKMSRGVANVSSRLFGAAVGRQVAQITGGGTVQAPNIMSNAFAVIMDRAIGQLPARELLARAVTDPRWEAVLNSKVPRTPQEAHLLEQRLRRLVALSSASREVDE